jgi:hypothetical protein
MCPVLDYWAGLQLLEYFHQFLLQFLNSEFQGFVPAVLNPLRGPVDLRFSRVVEAIPAAVLANSVGLLLSDYFKQFLLSFFNKFSHEFLLPLLNLYFTTALTTVPRGLSLPLKPSHSRHPLALQKVLEYKQQRLKPVSPCLEFC